TCELTNEHRTLPCETTTAEPYALATKNSRDRTRWRHRPFSPAASAQSLAVASRDDLVACVDASADQIAAELISLQFRGNGGADWPCPLADGSPSGAFLSPDT